MLDLRKISVGNNYIKSHLLHQKIALKLNPHLAHHFGGILEKLKRSAKRTLLIIFSSQQLKAENFETIVAETEGLLNSGPIKYVSSDTHDKVILTPNHFLIRCPYSALSTADINKQKF